MSVLHCDRCGDLFETDRTFMAADIEVISRDSHETIDQVLLCESCTRSIGADLSLETTIHEHK